MVDIDESLFVSAAAAAAAAAAAIVEMYKKSCGPFVVICRAL